jgi:hypothetical protein
MVRLYAWKLAQCMALSALVKSYLEMRGSFAGEMYRKEIGRQDRGSMTDSVIRNSDEQFQTTYPQAVGTRKCYSACTSILCPCRVSSRANGTYSPMGSLAAEAGLRTVVWTYRSCHSAR